LEVWGRQTAAEDANKLPHGFFFCPHGELQSDFCGDKVSAGIRAMDLKKRLNWLSQHWNWTAQLGTALVLLGFAALLTTVTNIPRQEFVFGWLIVLSGVVESVHAFYLRREDKFLLHIVPGIAGLPIGLLIITHPDAGAMVWMLLFASFLTVIGLFRIVSAIRFKFPGWAWAEFDGIATLLLGLVLWAARPWLAPQFMGMAVGVSLLLRGWSSVMLAMGLRSLRPGTSTRLRAA
jgi:uncharacterized membrane protein HdeD (DUF308 family)